MSVRIAIVPFDGFSPYNTYIAASSAGVELQVPDGGADKDAFLDLPLMSATAARMLADALRNAADEVERLDNDKSP